MHWSGPIGLAGVLGVWLTLRSPSPVEGRVPEAAVIQPEVARTVFRSNLQLFVDIQWLRALNLIGLVKTPDDARQLSVLGNFIADLDPRFYTPYWTLAINVPVNTGHYVWKNCDLAVKLYGRGLEQYPGDLRLLLLLAWTQLECSRDYPGAARTYAEAARNPDAPRYAGVLAARLHAQEGSPEAGLALMRELLASAVDDESRALYESRILDLETEIVLNDVDKALARYTEVFGHGPDSVDELVRQKYLPTWPKDPRGGEILLGYDGRPFSTTEQRRLTINVDPKDFL